MFDNLQFDHLNRLVSLYVSIPVPLGDANREDLTAVSTYPTKWGEYAIVRFVDAETRKECFHAEYTPATDWSTTHVLARKDSFEEARVVISTRIAAQIYHDPAAHRSEHQLFRAYFAEITSQNEATRHEIAAE